MKRFVIFLSILMGISGLMTIFEMEFGMPRWIGYVAMIAIGWACAGRFIEPKERK